MLPQNRIPTVYILYLRSPCHSVFNKDINSGQRSESGPMLLVGIVVLSVDVGRFLLRCV